MKTNLKIIIATVICLINIDLPGRNTFSRPFLRPAGGDVESGFTFYFGGAAAFLLHPSFGEFTDGYNSYYGASGLNILDKELKNFGGAYGYRFGMQYHSKMKIGFSVNYEQLVSRTSADITGGGKQHFTHVVRSSSLGVSTLLNHFRFDFKLGIAAPVIESSYEYADGTISFGREQLLNGIYTGFSFYLGGEFAARFILTPRIALEGGVAISGNFMGYYEESNWRKGEVYVQNYGFVYPNRLPTDFDSYTTVSWDNYDDKKAVKSTAVYPNLFLNLCITLHK